MPPRLNLMNPDLTVGVQLGSMHCTGTPKLFHFRRRRQYCPVNGNPLPSVNFSIRGDPLTQALFDHLLFAPGTSGTPSQFGTHTVLYRVTFEKRHCWSGWESGWTWHCGCHFEGLTVWRRFMSWKDPTGPLTQIVPLIKEREQKTPR